MTYYFKMNGKTRKRKNTPVEDTKKIKEYALDAMKKSYLTGASAVIESKGTCRKVAKFGILMFCFTGFLWQSCLFLNLYYQYPTITVTGSMKHMLKPAVTICDKNLERVLYILTINKSVNEAIPNVTESGINTKRPNNKYVDDCCRISRRYYCERYPTFCNDYRRTIRNNSSFLEYFCAFFPPFCTNKNDIYLKVPRRLSIKYTTSYYNYNFVKQSGFQIKDCLFLCIWSNVSIQKRSQYPIPCREPSYVRALNKEKYPGACYTMTFDSNPNSYNADILNPQANLLMMLKWRTSDLVNVASNVLNKNYAEPREYYISFHDPARLSNPYFEGITVRDSIHYKVKVSQINNIRLPPPFSSQCTDYRKEWIRNGENGPLTKEECYQNCHFEEELKRHGCVSLKVSYPHKEKLCLRGKVYLDLELVLKIQTCQERCKDACFETKYLATTNLYKNLAVEESLKLLNASTAVKVEVSFDISNSKEYKDIAKFEAIEIFSYIGSYLSMWLGWSCIAVFDFVEIFTRIFLFLCKKIKPKRKI